MSDSDVSVGQGHLCGAGEERDGWIVQSVPEVAPEQTDEVERETVSEVGVPQRNSIRSKLNRFRDSSQICRLEAY